MRRRIHSFNKEYKLSFREYIEGKSKMLKGIKTLDDFKVKGKKTLVRVDINSPVSDGKIVDNERIVKSGETIKELQNNGARVVVIGHQSRPGKKDFTSLEGHGRLLNKYCRISYVPDVIGERARTAIDGMSDGDAVLLDNLRTLEEELDVRRAEKMVDFFEDVGIELYFNDAFSVSHRDQTSISVLPRYFQSGMGRTFERELRNIGRVKSGNCCYVLGGNKPEDVMLLIKNEKIIATGVLSILCQIADGKNLGLENKLKRDMADLIPNLKRELGHIHVPSDFGFYVDERRADVAEDGWPVDARALDIGKKTIGEYEEVIAGCNRGIMKGTAGDYERAGFGLGTKRLLKAMERSKGFWVVAGGHSSSAVKKFGIDEDKLGYVSLSGGALVYYIAGKKLIGIEALKKGVK